MIEYLPLLPSDFKLWDWTRGNGTATAEQTQLAYDAVANQGRCDAFSRFVWNDLVDKVNAAVTGVGLKWDATYGTAESCKIMKSLDPLTASAFNAVALNIQQLGFMRGWRWAISPTVLGYVGRTEFRGRKDYGAGADYVFGWYILELTKWLNHALKIYLNQADFSEFDSGIKASACHSVIAERVRITPAIFVGDSNSVVDANLAKVRISALISAPHGQTYSNSLLLPQSPGLLKTDAQAVSIPDAEGFRIKVQAAASDAKAESIGVGLLHNGSISWMATGAYALTIPWADGDKIKSQAMFHRGFMESMARTTLDSIGAAALVHISQSHSSVIATLDASNLAFADSQSIVNSAFIAQILPSIPAAFCAIENGHSYDSALMGRREPMLLTTCERPATSELADLRALERAVLNAAEEAQSIQDANMQRLRAASVQLAINAISSPIAHGGAMVSVPADGLEQSKGYYQSAGAARKAASIEFAGKAKSHIDVSAKSVRAQCAGSTIHAKSDFICDGKTCIPAKAEGTENAQSFSAAEITKGIPGFAESTEHESSVNMGVVVRFPVRPFTATENAQSYTGSVGAASAANIATSICRSASATCCEMDMEYVSHDPWRDPIRNGNDLYIRSAHPQWQEGSTVHLDSGGVYYDPVQTGTEIYIRSTDSIKEVIKNG